jgi:colanic acid biosynthesis glycosyl transferase WcaI
MLHLFSFSFTSFFALFRNLFWKPEVLIVVAPTILCAQGALIFSRISRVKSVLHIQDFELDAMFGLSMAGGARFRQLAYWFERKILRAFDHISTISEGMLERAVGKGVDRKKLILFPNWSDLEHFREAERDESLLTRLGVDPDKKLILYAGSMGEKQGLKVILEVAERVRDKGNLQFLLVGEGGARSKLVAQCQCRQLDNVVFAPLQPYEVLPSLLVSADCHLVIQRRGAADSVLPSKLTNILAVGGNAVITADPDTSLGKLVRDWPGIALLVEPESASSLAQGIEQALAMPTVNTVATSYAEQFLDMDTVLRRFLRSIGA